MYYYFVEHGFGGFFLSFFTGKKWRRGIFIHHGWATVLAPIYLFFLSLSNGTGQYMQSHGVIKDEERKNFGS